METIKKLLTSWDTARIIKALATVLLLIGYLTTKESLYLVGSIFFGFQALLNIGCPGGACSTNIPDDKNKQVMKFDQYKPNKDNKDV